MRFSKFDLPASLPHAVAELRSTPAAAAQLWREWRAKRRPVVLRPYVDLNSWWRLSSHALLPLGLGAFCFVYGFFFALTAPYLLVPMLAPVVILALLSIWALPQNNVVPTKAMEFTFSALLVGLVMWPNYLALSLPGLPWITMVRLTSFPMAFFLLLSLSMSPIFRARVGEMADGVPMLMKLLLVFSANAFVSLPLSHHVGDSINKVILQQINWTGVFIVSLYIFRKPGRADRYVGLLLAMVLALAPIAFFEFEEQKVLWAGQVPNFLRVEDESAQRALTAAVRGATGLYRVKGTFSTPLGLGEFMGLMTPFAMHWAVARYRWPIRVLGLLLLPTIFTVVRMTDARLGVVGYLVSILVYCLLWSLVRWRKKLNDIVGAAVVYGSPAIILGVLAASMFVHKIHVLIFGGGAQSASNLHRQEQYRMAFPALLKNPLGYGAGQSGGAMGYGAGDFIAIDSYYINVALDYGVIGLVLYTAFFAMVIVAIVRTLLTKSPARHKEVGLLVPLAACLAAFMLVRSVFGQPEIHPLIFTLVGMAVCLVTRTKAVEAAADRAPEVKKAA